MSSSPFTLWLTGPEPAAALPIADEIARRLAARHVSVESLDARTSGIETVGADGVAFVARVLARHGIATVVALPAGRRVRERARQEIGRLIEVHVHPAGRAAAGYEPPERAEVEIVLPEPSPGAGVERTLRTLEVLKLLVRDEESAYSEEEEREVIRRLKAFGYL